MWITGERTVAMQSPQVRFTVSRNCTVGMEVVPTEVEVETGGRA